MRLLVTFLLLASSTLAQSGTGGDSTVTSSTSGTTGSVLGSRAWAPGPLYPYLPIAVTNVTPPDTSGYTILADVTSDADLTTKLATATAGCSSTGYVINLPQGTSYAKRTLAPTTCTTNYIIIQTKGLDWTTTPWNRGTRVDPSTAAGVMAKFTTGTCCETITTTTNVAVNNYWLRGLEIESTTNTAAPSIVTIGPSTVTDPANSVNNFILDHDYIHGRVSNNMTHGVVFSAGNNLALVDSWVSDIHDVGNDSQAISGYIGGPWLAQNNFLEASGEVILFGGSGVGPAQNVFGRNPTDYTEQYNWLYKPKQWWPGNGSVVFEGVAATPFAWDVKNIHEYKRCVRCLVQYEILENSWAANQTGQSLLSNQAASSDGPYSLESDHTFQYIHVIGGNGALEGQGRDTTAFGGDVPRSYRVMFRNILFEGMNNNNCDVIRIVCAGARTDWAGFSTQMFGVIVDHITSTASNSVVQSVAQFSGSNGARPDTYMTYFSNSILAPGTSFAFHNPAPPPADNTPAAATKYWGGTQDVKFNNNVFADSAASGFSCATWNATFSGNQCPANMAAVGFVNWNSGLGGDYHLTPGSAYSSTGTNPCKANPDATGANTDCGADITTILAQTTGLDTVPSLWPDSRTGGGIALSSASMTCNNSNTVNITPVAGSQGGNLFVQAGGLDVMFHGTVITPTASSTTSITIKPPTYSGAVAAITATDLGVAAANLITFTAANTLKPGDLVTTTVTDNPNAPAGFFNLTDAFVHSSTSTLFRVVFPHALIASAAVTGTATSKVPIAVNNFGMPLTVALQCN